MPFGGDGQSCQKDNSCNSQRGEGSQNEERENEKAKAFRLMT